MGERQTEDLEVPGSIPGLGTGVNFIVLCLFFVIAQQKLLDFFERIFFWSKSSPNIAQLVERSTVGKAGIEWSLVRFRVFGIFFQLSEAF